MNRFNWTYIADNGKKHHVGLLHASSTGHLLVYCNSRIMIIDFHVLQDASYSFFIEDELCEIMLERKGNQFYYGFEINRNADTPRNRARRKKDKRHLIQSLLFLGGFVLVLIGVVAGLRYWNEVKDKVELADQLKAVGEETSATVLLSSNGDRRKISYFFLVEGKAYTVEKEVSDKEAVLLETGMPLEKGDEFMVRYIPNDPHLHLPQYNRPTPRQVNIYKQRAIKKFQQLHPGKDAAYVSCLADIAYELKGVKGYADFYFQEALPSENPAHNVNSFNRLIRDQPFRDEVRKRCFLYQ